MEEEEWEAATRGRIQGGEERTMESDALCASRIWRPVNARDPGRNVRGLLGSVIVALK